MTFLRSMLLEPNQSQHIHSRQITIKDVKFILLTRRATIVGLQDVDHVHRRVDYCNYDYGLTSRREGAQCLATRLLVFAALEQSFSVLTLAHWNGC